jgi:hypothetical protein
MLFDLRRRGRRRTVKIIYTGLAVLIGVGLVGFGIGTGVNGGGVVNAVSENNKGGGTPTFQKQVTEATRRTQDHPNEAAAWAALTEAQLHEADVAPYYDQATGRYTSQGKELLARVYASWNRYLALEANEPSPQLAERVLPILGTEGLNQPAAAVRALQIVIPSREPSAALYASLAQYAYKAKNQGLGELAAKKAVELAPPSQRKSVKEQLEYEAAKALGSGGPGAATGAATGPTTK